MSAYRTAGHGRWWWLVAALALALLAHSLEGVW